MLALIVSPAALYERGNFSQKALDTLGGIRAQGTPVYVVTNQGVPDGLVKILNGLHIVYVHAKARQTGNPVREIAQSLKINPHDVMVLAVNEVDMQMAKTGGAILIEGAWSTDKRVAGLGIKVDTIDQLREVIDVTRGWTSQWWYKGEGSAYDVRALVDLSSNRYVSDDQAAFARKVTNTAKSGGARLTALLAIACRSLKMDNVLDGKLFWGVFPSSASSNDDTEVLSDFVQRLRTAASSVHFAKRGEPLFIRHTHSVKRSTSNVGDRTDPSNQIETLHLNPAYKSQLKGRNVIVVDDCTTYGVSFAVAAAFLYAAGVKKVVGIALGKFGNRLEHATISIATSPFEVVSRGGYQIVSREGFRETNDPNAQAVLQAIIS
ncbi:MULTISPECIES: HAD family hydrolase [Pseudomonas]|uniref:HAD family hydrolase n=1 Tax=Pseudomonas TaxID=286 RepID=UPI000811A88C|nr:MULTISPECIES: HAD family hydrolase [Pseudomonas]